MSKKYDPSQPFFMLIGGILFIGVVICAAMAISSKLRIKDEEDSLQNYYETEEYAEAYDRSYESGYDEGFEAGCRIGESDGRYEGYSDGYNDGYLRGWNEAGEHYGISGFDWDRYPEEPIDDE